MSRVIKAQGCRLILPYCIKEMLCCCGVCGSLCHFSCEIARFQLSHPPATLMYLSSLTLHSFLAISLLLYPTHFQKTTAQSSTLFPSIPTQDVTFSKGSAETSLLTSITFGKEVCFLRSWVVSSMLLNLANYEMYNF